MRAARGRPLGRDYDHVVDRQEGEHSEAAEYLIVPSLVCMIIPVWIASFLKPFRGTFDGPESDGSRIQLDLGCCTSALD